LTLLRLTPHNRSKITTGDSLVPKTLLAVDDSATMRKVLEITFSGEDFKVLTADTGQGAIAKLGDSPNVIVLDTSLGGEDAYALAKDLRAKAPSATLVLMASKYNPYDAGKGKDAGADDFIDKPFDTQALLDKVRKAMLARESGAPATAAAAAPVGKPAPAPGPTSTVPSVQSPFAQQPKPAPQPAVAVAPPAAAAAKPAAAPRNATLVFGAETPAAKPAPSPAPAPVAAKPAAAAPAAAVAASVNGHLAGKLGELGLSSQQAEAVLALSREVVERVVWEVVPQLAEAMIKEEIARLMKE
jgi:CheY-like chemotaxis protein